MCRVAIGGEPLIGADGRGVWVNVSGGRRCALSCWSVGSNCHDSLLTIIKLVRSRIERTNRVACPDKVYCARIQDARRIGSKQFGRQGKSQHDE